ncbi:Acyl-CoA-binding domain-containing protein 5 [Mortierella polycephala]|uniref:Acyl-CoA-binding domain-containing protein 5 n=1 Tax=Mortierella polycephala TaxID=41804 RepID=A0A9P6U0Y1_9FUNG|nr:Acyl-CoA-binding domain-containing protein 5 [Mortierella polycephala]
MAVTDPNTGLVYVPSGSSNMSSMAVYNPATTALESVDMPSSDIMELNIQYYSAVWSTLRNSIFLYGGVNTKESINNLHVVEYQPSTSTWTRFNTTGSSPSGSISSHCMVPAYDGTKMILFGGKDKDSQLLGSIYIFDLASMSWTKGADIDPSQNRASMACTVAGDNFVAWGGSCNKNATKDFETTIIYNLKSQQWTDEFSIASPYSASRAYVQTSSDDINVAAIGGGVGAAAVIFIIGAFVVSRIKSHRSIAPEPKTSASVDTEKNKEVQPSVC